MTAPFTTASGSDVRVRLLPRARPGRRTSASSAPPCSTGRTRATPAASSSSASRTPTPRVTARSRYAADPRRRCGGSGSTGTRASRPVGTARPVPPVASAPAIYDDVIATLKAAGRRLRVLRHAARRWRRVQHRRRSRPEAGLRQPRARPDRRRSAQAFRDQGRAAGAAPAAVPDRDLSFDDLVRGEITFTHRHRSRLRRGRAPERQAAVHVHEPGRRRTDGRHARAAWRGLLSSTPAADRPATRRCIEIGIADFIPRLRSPAVRRWARATRSSPSATPSRTSSTTATPACRPRGARQLPGAARLVDRPRPRRVLDRRDGRAPFETSPT